MAELMERGLVGTMNLVALHRLCDRHLDAHLRPFEPGDMAVLVRHDETLAELPE